MSCKNINDTYKKQTTTMHLFTGILAAGNNQCGDWVPLLESCYLFSDTRATWGAAMVSAS